MVVIFVCVSFYVLLIVSGSISSSLAMVMFDNFQCDVTYTISAGGTLQGELVGPNLLFGNVMSGPCPPEVTSTSVMPTGD